MIEKESQLDVPESEDNFSPEHASELLMRLVEVAVEVDKEAIEAVKVEDLGDDDIDIMEKFFAWLDGQQEVLTKEEINFYTKARDITREVSANSSNSRAKDIIANIIINKTASIWAN
jgi:hypothetical protein